MENIKCIKSRRSIRHFMDKEIPEPIVKELLEAVRWAPSWANTQCWEVIVVKEQAVKEKIAELVGDHNPAAKAIVTAPLIMIMCAIRGRSGYKKGELVTNKGDWSMFDMGIAGQNLCLTAHDLGLGTVHVGLFDHKRLDQLMGLPENTKTVEIIPVGYPAREGTAPPRKELAEFVHLNRYGQVY